MRYSTLGLTAFDLLVAMTIAAILITAGVPAFREYGLNLRMKAALTALQSDLQFARNEAVTHHVHTITCTGNTRSGCNPADWQAGWIVFADLNGDRQWQPDERLLRTGPAIDAIHISSSASRRTLRFFPNGSSPGSNATIHFCDARGAAHGHQLRISNTGRIRRLGPSDGISVSCA